jgi:hypothetical protein
VSARTRLQFAYLPQVHSRWLNLWARRIMASPEQALVPLKERDALLASKHEVSGQAHQLGSLLQQPGVCTSSSTLP